MCYCDNNILGLVECFMWAVGVVNRICGVRMLDRTTGLFREKNFNGIKLSSFFSLMTF